MHFSFTPTQQQKNNDAERIVVYLFRYKSEWKKNANLYKMEIKRQNE